MRLSAIVTAMACFAVSATVYAAPAPTTVVLTLKDHVFSPATISVPAGQKVKIDLTNRDASADDFESADLHVDKDVGPHGRVSFVIGPLKPGHYAFKGELHEQTAKGEVIAR